MQTGYSNYSKYCYTCYDVMRALTCLMSHVHDFVGDQYVLNLLKQITGIVFTLNSGRQSIYRGITDASLETWTIVELT